MRMSIYAQLMRLHTPTGFMLLFYPCAFAICTNCKDNLILSLIIFLYGAIFARAAFCIINDYFDKDFDKFVLRTKNRPLALGILSTKEIIFTLSFALVNAFCVFLYLNIEAKILTLFFALLALFYPFCKRFTFFPQMYLGIVFASGSLIAALNCNKTLTINDFILYLGCVFWIISYDTIYGFMDIKDDRKIGVKSFSIYLENTCNYNQNYIKCVLILFYFVFLALICFLNINNILMLIFIFLFNAYDILNLNNEQSMQRHFYKQNITGVFVSCLLLI
jgi:4-hydroxybenzoate polyprenyltransferase